MYDDLISQLIASGRLDYGERIHRDELLRMAEVEPLKDADTAGLSLRQIERMLSQQQLVLLSISDSIKRVLLPMGRYFGQDGDHFRVALPSENIRHAERYFSAASRKRKRGEALLSATPVDTKTHDLYEARLLSSSLRSSRITDRI